MSIWLRQHDDNLQEETSLAQPDPFESSGLVNQLSHPPDPRPFALTHPKNIFRRISAILKLEVAVVLLGLFFIALLVGSILTIGSTQNESRVLTHKLQSMDQVLAQFRSMFEQNREGQLKLIQQIIHLKKQQSPWKSLPRIIWIYTQFKFNGQKMLEQVLGNHLIQLAKQSNYQVRLVNSWSAYQWLTPNTQEKITKTMQNMQLQQSINDLLRLAILMDNGGIMVKVPQIVMVENLDWLGEYFLAVGDPEHKNYNQVLLFSQQRSASYDPVYQDCFIAAVKEAALIIDTFEAVCKIISTGKLRFSSLKDFLEVNEEMNSTSVRDLNKNVINAWLNIMAPEYYLAKIVAIDNEKFFSTPCRDNFILLLKEPTEDYHKKCGQPQHFIHITDRNILEGELELQIDLESPWVSNSSYWYQVMTNTENRKIYQPLPPREVQFCILDPHPSSKLKDIKNSIQLLKIQSYTNWTAVYFVDNITQNMQDYQHQQSTNGITLVLYPSTESIGHNYEKGIIKACPNKSFILLLNKTQALAYNYTLQTLATSLAPREVLGAFLGLRMANGEVKIPAKNFADYNKLEYNGPYPKYDQLEMILNHLRVFHSDCYKIIPQFNLRTPQGVYFNDRFIFLEQFLFMVRNLTQKHDSTEVPHTQRVKWLVKSSSQTFDVPFRILLQPLSINTRKWESINQAQIKMNNFKTDSSPMTYNLDHLMQNGQTLQDLAVFNPAHDYQPYTTRSHLPPLIPKIIHQIWIDGKLPAAKRVVMEANMQYYPDFQHKIWTKDNITRQNFPLSYDLLMTLYQAQSYTRFSKRATMADIMRHQILYNEGGFYMDISMMLFNNVFYQWLSYKLVIAAQRTFRHRWSQSMCFFAVMPKFPGLLRVISPNNTNRYNIYLRDAAMIAGPKNFRLLIQGHEQYDPDYLVMEYSTFYPSTYSFFVYEECYCAIEPKYLNKGDQIMYRIGDKVIIKNCGKYYPYSFGKELNTIGISWKNPKD